MSIILPPDSPVAQPDCQDVPTSLYRYYDKYDVLIYVGITGRGLSRNSEHNLSKDWWPYVARQTVEHLDSRPLALERERYLIKKWSPPFNTQHNPRHKALRRAYKHLHATGALTPDLSMPSDATDKALLVEAQRLMKQTDKRLPLTSLGMSPTGKYLFCTEPEHLFLARRIKFERFFPLGSWGREYATLQSVSQTPAGAVLQIKSPIRIATRGASVRLKWAEQKPPSFTIAAMSLRWLPTVNVEDAA